MGTKLKQIRVSAGLTQLELSNITGINLRTLQYYEQGSKKIEHAKLETILKLCVALNKEISEIIDDDALLSLYERYMNPVE